MVDTVKTVLEKIAEQVSSQGEAVEEIVLDHMKFETFNNEIKEALENHNTTLEVLSLNDCGLSNLENFPGLINIKRLELADNKLSGEHLKALSDLPDVQSLSLGANLISEYTDIEILAELPALKQLDLAACPITSKSDYREKILDNLDKEGKEVQYDDEEDEGAEEEGEEGEGEEEGNEHGGNEEDEEEDEAEGAGDEVEYEDVDGGQVVKKKLKTE